MPENNLNFLDQLTKMNQNNFHSLIDQCAQKRKNRIRQRQSNQTLDSLRNQLSANGTNPTTSNDPSTSINPTNQSNLSDLLNLTNQSNLTNLLNPTNNNVENAAITNSWESILNMLLNKSS